MTGEEEAANVWAALTGLAVFIAVTLTAGYWLCVYHQEATDLEPCVTEPCTTLTLILDEIPIPP
jgi:hypothetical protein